jgi:hypothetical protein
MWISRRSKPKRARKSISVYGAEATACQGAGHSLYTADLHKRRGQIAQLVEQGIENPRVGGSIPSLATIVC